MIPVAIQDANVIIDLANSELLIKVVKELKYKFCITDLVLTEITEPLNAITAMNNLIDEGLIEIISFNPDDIVGIMSLDQNYPSLSIQDSSCLFYGIKRNALILTGDKALRKASAKEGVKVKGTLGLLDDLVLNQIITKTEAHVALTKIVTLNQRLPKKECDKRFELWISCINIIE